MTPVNKSRLLNISHLYKVHMTSNATNSHCARGWTALHTWGLHMKTRDGLMKLTYIIELRKLKALSLSTFENTKTFRRLGYRNNAYFSFLGFTQYISWYEHIQQIRYITWVKYTKCWQFPIADVQWYINVMMRNLILIKLLKVKSSHRGRIHIVLKVDHLTVHAK